MVKDGLVGGGLNKRQLNQRDRLLHSLGHCPARSQLWNTTMNEKTQYLLGLQNF